jgi:hypothetical protein
VRVTESFLAEASTGKLIQAAKIASQQLVEETSFWDMRGAAYAAARRLEKVILEMDARERQGRLTI